MNFSAILGLALTSAVIWFGVLETPDHLKSLLIPQIVLVVFGGTLSASLAVFSFRRLFGIFRFLFFGVIFKSRSRDYSVATEVVTLYFNYMLSPDKFVVDFKFHPFLVEGIGIIKKSKMSNEDLRDILESRVEFLQRQYSSDTQMLRSISKYPPVFGFIGAVGMLLHQVSETGGSLEQSLIPLLVSCLWGWVVPAVILLPLADHSEKICDDEIQTRSMIMHALIVMNSRQSVTYLTETLSGYLSVKDRKRIKEFTAKTIAQSNLNRVVNKPEKFNPSQKEEGKPKESA